MNTTAKVININSQRETRQKSELQNHNDKWLSYAREAHEIGLKIFNEIYLKNRGLTIAHKV